VAFITKDMRASAGLVISASHNPYQDNGIKVFGPDGYKLPDAEEARIEELIESGRVSDVRPTAEDIGKARRIDDAVGRYIVFCKNTFPADLSLDGLKLVLDCANGATYKIAPIIFSELGARVTAIGCEPDGKNINAGCGSQYPGKLAEEVRRTGADLGLAFDGDGDRVIAVDENGDVLTGDHILAICAQWYKQQGRLVNNLVVSTVMSNFGFLKALRELEIDHAAGKVGDRYVLELMRRRGAVIGGEPSGHMIFLNHHTTGDGIIAALQLLGAMRAADRPLSALSAVMTMAPQKLINVEIRERRPLEDVAPVQDAVREAETRLDGKGRVLVRYSGTQPMCRVMVEGPTVELTESLCCSLADAVRRHLG
jgi:phosphoglucosamine mutase